jgi:hypothetical protein
MLHLLWTVTSDLYIGRDAHELWHLCVDLVRQIEELLGHVRAMEPEHVRVHLYSEFLPMVRAGPEVTNAATRLSLAALDLFGPDALALALGARPQVIVNRICHALKRAGFSYAEIARLIGDRTEGAVDRIRKRCKRPTG